MCSSVCRDVDLNVWASVGRFLSYALDKDAKVVESEASSDNDTCGFQEKEAEMIKERERRSVVSCIQLADGYTHRTRTTAIVLQRMS